MSAVLRHSTRDGEEDEDEDEDGDGGLDSNWAHLFTALCGVSLCKIHIEWYLKTSSSQAKGVGY